ncbi:unnamed protein product, partial [marine sediment metagenome]
MRKFDMTVKKTGFFLWPIVIILTIVFWEEIRTSNWYWQAIVVIGYLLLLGTLRSDADHRAEIDSYHNSVRVLISEKKYSEALKIAESALANSPENAPLLYAQGECHQNLGHIQEAEQAYLKATEVDP